MKQIRNKSIAVIMSSIVILTMLASQCQKEDGVVYIENDTDSTIYVGCHTVPFKTKDLLYERLSPAAECLPPHESSQGITINEDNSIYCIIITESSMEKYSVPEMVESDYSDAKYSFTYEQMKALNFKIKYTGK